MFYFIAKKRDNLSINLYLKFKKRIKYQKLLRRGKTQLEYLFIIFVIRFSND